MARTISHMIAAGVAALSLSAGAFANDTYPLSANESGPVYPQYSTAPAQREGATRGDAPARDVGATQSNAPAREIGSRSYEVQTPSSVSESAPWLTGSGRR
jgi:hypothetical protein